MNAFLRPVYKPCLAVKSLIFQVSVPIVSNESCKQMFFRAGRHEVIPHIFMCAGYDNGGRDSCQVRNRIYYTKIFLPLLR